MEAGNPTEEIAPEVETPATPVENTEDTGSAGEEEVEE